MKQHQARHLLKNVAVVLKETNYAANVGSVARAMMNMGLSDLRLVTPPRDRNDEARKLAHNAASLLDKAVVYKTLPEALADRQMVVGMTARTGGWRKQLLTPRRCIDEIVPLLPTNKIALLFGPEDCGLLNEDIILCSHLVRIPTSPELASLNLSQAVMVLAYELWIAVHEYHQPADKPKPHPSATLKDVEHMNRQFLRMLEDVGFYNSGDYEYWYLSFRNLFARARPTPVEVNILRGMCKQVIWFTQHGLDKRFAQMLDEMSATPRKG